MPDMKYTVSDGAKYILNALTGAGYEAYAVGGAVRDILLGDTPSDYDITTSATPDEVKRVFASQKTVDTGIKHGTVTVLYDGAPYEVTTYRTETGYADNRHPDSVSFTTSLRDDLSRRDFTVNAMCINAQGELYDAFCGANDLKKGIIRTVGEAEKRFSEDALRILRALRFSSKLDFEIEKKTAEALFKTRALLDNVSGERIYSEILKLLSGKGALRVLRDYFEIITYALTSLKEIKIINEKGFEALSPTERLIALYLTGSPCDYSGAINKLCDRLHTDREIRKHAIAVGELINYPVCDFRDVLKMLSHPAGEYTASALAISYAVGMRHDDGEALLKQARESGIPHKISALATNGSDIKALGFKGERIGKLLSEMLSLIIDGKLENSREALLKYAEMQTKLYKTEE